MNARLALATPLGMTKRAISGYGVATARNIVDLIYILSCMECSKSEITAFSLNYSSGIDQSFVQSTHFALKKMKAG